MVFCKETFLHLLRVVNTFRRDNSDIGSSIIQFYQ